MHTSKPVPQVLSPCGRFFITGHKAGRLRAWRCDASVVQPMQAAHDGVSSTPAPTSTTTTSSSGTNGASTSHAGSGAMGSMPVRWAGKRVVLGRVPSEGEELNLPGTALCDTVDCLQFLGLLGSDAAAASGAASTGAAGAGSGGPHALEEALAGSILPTMHGQASGLAGRSAGGQDEDEGGVSAAPLHHEAAPRAPGGDGGGGTAVMHGRLAAKAADGRLGVWDLHAQQQVGGSSGRIARHGMPALCCPAPHMQAQRGHTCMHSCPAVPVG